MVLNKRLATIALLASAAAGSALPVRALHAAPPVSSATGDAVLDKAFRERAKGLQVEGTGEVTRLLSDDNKGSRHQRFVLKLGSGQTLLVSHNLNLAPRVPAKVRDRVSFFGEYEWNQEGGVIHWTHRDPAKRHADGWLKHKDKTYQ